MNLNKVARDITLKEGGKVNLSVAQVKEVLSLTLTEFGRYPPSEVMKAIENIVRKRKR